MLTITISTRALVIVVLMLLGAIAAVFATDALAGGSGDQIQGDVNCNGGVDNNDILDQLRHEAGFDVSQSEPCTDIEAAFPLGTTIVGPAGPSGVPGLPGPSGALGPTGAPGERGPAGITLFANVGQEGDLRSGNALYATEITDLGLFEYYIVGFDQDVSNCAPVVTLGHSPPVSSWYTGDNVVTIVGLQGIQPHEVRVDTRGPNGMARRSAFHLIVVC